MAILQPELLVRDSQLNTSADDAPMKPKNGAMALSEAACIVTKSEVPWSKQSLGVAQLVSLQATPGSSADPIKGLRWTIDVYKQEGKFTSKGRREWHECIL